ncbi:hypothetical protein MXMO3_00347 [Maritalea myrionectae]|uniref:Uncharacterized protein n=1 Tax=Maritalea myrionectae TaxID=454601 RepID=A0A2R4MAC3_9HYPH|nr:hypothetical protein MXMO3_00347 [Maritalea myrionectae]
MGDGLLGFVVSHGYSMPRIGLQQPGAKLSKTVFRSRLSGGYTA